MRLGPRDEQGTPEHEVNRASLVSQGPRESPANRSVYYVEVSLRWVDLNQITCA